MTKGIDRTRRVERIEICRGYRRLIVVFKDELDIANSFLGNVYTYVAETSLRRLEQLSREHNCRVEFDGSNPVTIIERNHE